VSTFPPSVRNGRLGRALPAALVIALAGCGPQEAVWDDGVCDPPETSYPLPQDIAESSGVAASRAHPGVFWTHNDSGWDPVIFAVDSSGAILTRVRVAGATNRDWEDIELAACSPGSADWCLFIGDIGDNNERHPRIGIYRIPEPDPRADTVSAPAVIFRATYSDGPRDAEALFVTDQGIHIINKGRSHAIHVYLLPPPYRPGRTTVLTRLQQLAPPPTSVSAQVTAAAASPDQRRVVVRTYGELRFFEILGDTLTPVGRPAGLVAPEQRQGEGADFIDDQRLVLTSEQQAPNPASIVVVRCDPARPASDDPDPDPDSVAPPEVSAHPVHN
jgi:hypothetical protein